MSSPKANQAPPSRRSFRVSLEAALAGVIALAFPLHPPGQPGKSREAELRGAGTSVLVVNGERDPFGVPAPDEATEVVTLPGETHALSRHPKAVGDAVTAWLFSSGGPALRTNTLDFAFPGRLGIAVGQNPERSTPWRPA